MSIISVVLVVNSTKMFRVCCQFLGFKRLIKLACSVFSFLVYM